MLRSAIRVSPHAREMIKSSLRPTEPVRDGVISLRSGEPSQATPAPIVQRMAAALESGKTHYAPAGGVPALREAIADTLTRRYGVQLDSEQVSVTHGGTGALTAAIFSVVGPDDRVVIPTPTYSLFADLVELAGGTNIFVEPTARLGLDLDQIERALVGAVAIILCNPCNPTGLLYPRDEMLEIVRRAKQHGAVLIVDEAYARLVYEPETFHSVLELSAVDDNLIYCQTFSKEFAMTGWRIGYTVSGPERTAIIRQIVHSVDGSINTALQHAAIAALGLDDSWLQETMADYSRNRTLLMDRLGYRENLQIIQPEAGFFAFVAHGNELGSELLVRCLDAGVALRDGAEFGPGGERFVRFSYSVSSDELEQALDRLEDLWN